MAPDDTQEFVIDFQGPDKNRNRFYFLVIFAGLHLIFITYLTSTHGFKSFDELHRYDVAVDYVNCISYSDNIGWNDMQLRAGDHVFEAINVPSTHCNAAKIHLEKQPDTSIWHDNFLIYQLGKGGQHMSYSNQVRWMKSEQSESSGGGYFFLLLIFWFYGYKTIFNAIKPGTYQGF